MTDKPLLLDTCTLIWLTGGVPVAPSAAKLLDAAINTGTPTYLSPISAWELGMLVARGRLRLALDPESLFSGALSQSHMRLAPTPPELLIRASFLPGKPPRDPANRILAATARDLGARLVTRDRALLDYGAQGYISVVAC